MNHVFRLSVLLGFVALPFSAAHGAQGDNPFSEGLCRQFGSMEEGGEARVGFADFNGKWVIPPDFPSSEPFSSGMAHIRSGRPGDRSIDFYIDFTGKRLAPELVKRIQAGLHAVEKDRWWGFAVNGTDELVVEPKYDDVWDFSEGLALVYRAGEVPEYRWIDYTGVERISMPDLVNAESFHDGLAKVQIEILGAGNEPSQQKWGLIDRMGNFVVEPEYDEIADFYDGRARVRIERRHGFIDYSGKRVIPARYADAQDYSEGLAAVALGPNRAQWGYIDLDGNLVIDGGYWRVRPFYHGLAHVRGDSFQGFIDHSGNQVREAVIERISW